MARILAVDPGEVRIGLAVSDPSGMIARPLKVIRYQSRARAAETILEEARTLDAVCIVVGVAYDFNGKAGPQARKALRLVECLRARTDLSIVTWDESGSSQLARHGLKRTSLLDARAAAFILQEYLNAQ